MSRNGMQISGVMVLWLLVMIIMVAAVLPVGAQGPVLVETPRPSETPWPGSGDTGGDAPTAPPVATVTPLPGAAGSGAADTALTPSPAGTASITPTATTSATSTHESTPWTGPLAVIPAPDGQMLVGDLYLLSPALPTVILLHQLYETRGGWGMLVQPLMAAGFNVLVVDLRGHGATGGAIDWWASVEDVGVWLRWLRDDIGVRADAISTLGSSIGASVALLGCALDDLCRSAVALSPGWNYYGLGVELAFKLYFGARPVLLIYAEADGWPAFGVPLMVETATNPVDVELVPGRAHGMELLANDDGSLVARIVSWLALNGG